MQAIMPDWMWFIIAPLIVILVGSLIWIVLKRGINAKIAGQELNINGVPGSKPGNEYSEYQRNLLYDLESRLTEIYTNIKDRILHYMRHVLGIPENYLSSNDDYKFLLNLISLCVYGKNGRHSIRTILEDYIVSRHQKFKEEGVGIQELINRRSTTMSILIPQIDGELRKLIDEKYDNINTHFNPETKENFELKRAIECEKVCILVGKYVREELSPIIEVLLFGEILNKK